MPEAEDIDTDMLLVGRVLGFPNPDPHDPRTCRCIEATCRARGWGSVAEAAHVLRLAA